MLFRSRSQMAEGIARHYFGDRFEVFSAGTHPSFVHPYAIIVMAELGVDISGHRSKSVNEFRDFPVDYLLTVCGYADQRCPVFPGFGTRVHWGFEDPVSASLDIDVVLDEFRAVRDAIVRKFFAEWETTFT